MTPADLMKAALEGKKLVHNNAVIWELRDDGYWYADNQISPVDRGPLISIVDCKADLWSIYEEPPKTININGVDIPGIIQEELKRGDDCWYADPGRPEYCGRYAWEDNATSRLYLSRGLLHLDKESAALHGKALASFTKVDCGKED